MNEKKERRPASKKKKKKKFKGMNESWLVDEKNVLKYKKEC